MLYPPSLLFARPKKTPANYNSKSIFSQLKEVCQRVGISFKNYAAEHCRRWVIDGQALGKESRLPSRRLEAAGARKKGRARETRVSSSRAPVPFCAYFCQAPAMQATKEGSAQFKGIWIPESGNFACRIRNTCLWNPKYSPRTPESL